MSAYQIYSPEDDEAAFAAVYRAHHEKLLRYCQYRLRDRHEAEDVVQEAFARAWRTMPVGGLDGNFYPWLRVVAGNLCTDILRKRSRSQPVAVIDLVSVDGGVESVAEESERAMVRQALGRLNDRHRSALMMREDEGLTYDQIAARTGVTSGTVESLLWRARQALKREFTVLAGPEGAFALVPFVLLLVGRTRSAGRRAGLRVLRRLVSFHSAGDTPPLAHAAVAAIAALSVAGGIAATLESGGHHHGGPAVTPGPVVTASSIVPASSLPGGPASFAGIPAGSTAAGSAGASAGTAAAAVIPAAGSQAATQPARPTPLHLVNPVAVGPSAATYAQQAPLTLHAGNLTVGISPSAVTDFAHAIVQRVAPPQGSALGNALQETHP